MKYFDQLKPNCYYHIYNRAIGNEVAFPSEGYYYMFLARFRKFLLPYVNVYAYCLLPNHFHFIISTKDAKDPVFNEIHEQSIASLEYGLFISKKFSNFFNSYTRTSNYFRKRKGAMFIRSFRRIEVLDDQYFTQLIYYTHRNPVHHELVKDMGDWPFSSYRKILSNSTHWTEKDFILKWFNGRNKFRDYHKEVTKEWLQYEL